MWSYHRPMLQQLQTFPTYLFHIAPTCSHLNHLGPSAATKRWEGYFATAVHWFSYNLFTSRCLSDTMCVYVLGIASCPCGISEKRSISSHRAGNQLQSLEFLQIQVILKINSFEKICHSPCLPLYWMIELNRYNMRKGNGRKGNTGWNRTENAAPY